jgi:hypothetical protein
MKPFTNRYPRCFALLGLLALPACGDDASSNDASTNDASTNEDDASSNGNQNDAGSATKGTVHGVVYDHGLSAEGKPRPNVGATVRLSLGQTTTTDSEGRFSFEDLPSASGVIVQVSAPGRMAQGQRVDVYEGVSSFSRLVLQPLYGENSSSYLASGAVLFQEGGGGASAWFPPGAFDVSDKESLLHVSVEWEHSPPTRDDGPVLAALGAFRLSAFDSKLRELTLSKGKTVRIRGEHLFGGLGSPYAAAPTAPPYTDFDIAVFHFDDESAVWEQRAVLGKRPWEALSLASFEADELGLWAVAPLQVQTGCVAGRVVDEQGNAQPGALVESASRAQHASSDSEGRFEMRLVAGWDYWLGAVHDLRMSPSVAVRVKAQKDGEGACESVGDLMLRKLDGRGPHLVQGPGVRQDCPQPGCGTSCDSLVQCKSSQQCINDACEDIVCPDGLTGCETTTGSRFECADLQSSISHCGECGHSCNLGAGEQCVAGKCEPVEGECPQGFLFCDGRCKNLAADVTSCGGCGVTCPSGSDCVDGVCECPAGLVAGTREYPVQHELCIDPNTDAMACGDARAFCPSLSCVDGQCVDGDEPPPCLAASVFPGLFVTPPETCLGAESNASDCGPDHDSCPLYAGGTCVSGECTCANPAATNLDFCL